MDYKTIAKNRARELRKNATQAEKRFISILRKYHIPYHFQKLVYVEKTFYILDFITLTNPRIIFELDGSSHNGRALADRKRTMDILNTEQYKDCKIVRFTNQDVYSGRVEIKLKSLFPKYLLAN